MNFVLEPWAALLAYVVLMYVVAVLGVRKWAASDDFDDDSEDRAAAFMIVVLAPVSVITIALILAFKFIYTKLNKVLLFGIKRNDGK